MYVVLVADEDGRVKLGRPELFDSIEEAQQTVQSRGLVQEPGPEENSDVYLVIKTGRMK